MTIARNLYKSDFKEGTSRHATDGYTGVSDESHNRSKTEAAVNDWSPFTNANPIPGATNSFHGNATSPKNQF